MKRMPGIGLSDVQAVYSGAEGRLWELVMGQQIHIGGFQSSMDLAEKAGIAAGTRGVDLCCCNGGGMRFLARYRQVARMTGVDATPAVVELGRLRTRQEGLAERIDFVVAEAVRTGLADAQADFVWGEDAWCYVQDKPALIAEAVRLVRPGGVIAFTDWVEGEEMTEAESRRFLQFMKFPTLANLADYRQLLEANGCHVCHAADTGRFAPCVDLYLDMLEKQLAGDALTILGHDMAAFQGLGGEMHFVRDLAKAGKVIQGLFVATKA